MLRILRAMSASLLAGHVEDEVPDKRYTKAQTKVSANVSKVAWGHQAKPHCILALPG